MVLLLNVVSLTDRTFDLAEFIFRSSCRNSIADLNPDLSFHFEDAAVLNLANPTSIKALTSALQEFGYLMIQQSWIRRPCGDGDFSGLCVAPTQNGVPR